ncbi:MAG: glycerate kinase [Flavobacteriaceae bacterium]
MKILIIPDSFKGCLSAKQVANAIEKGILDIFPDVEVEKLPFSDGGEGAIDILAAKNLGSLITIKTENALGKKMKAKYLLFNNKKNAWIELSQASGIMHINENQRNILRASTYGTGILIKHALDSGCQEIILGVGGSATNDAASGIFQALGGSLLDIKKKQIEKGGAELSRLTSIIDPKINRSVTWKIACDVVNPLIGENGASAIYGPQKGASEDEIEILENSLLNFSKVIKKHFGRSISKIKGGGAAGGVAAGMFGFFNAKLSSGFTILSEIFNLESQIKSADLIFTGEGKIDSQSLNGKLVGKLGGMAKENKIPIICLVGSKERGLDERFYENGLTKVFSIQKERMTIEESKSNASQLLSETAGKVLGQYINK